MLLYPHKDRILLKPIQAENKSAGGIVLQGELEPSTTGTVIVPPEYGTLPDGTIRDSGIHAGDVVMFGKHVGTQVKHDGEDMLIIREDDVLCKIKES